MSFTGAKLALFLGQKLVVILRDDTPDILYPDYWDLPGGGREGEETPKACALRETQEELGITLEELDIVWSREYRTDSAVSWFFAAHLPEARMDEICLGDEGQRWEMWTPEAYVKHPKAVPNFRSRLQEYLDAKSVDIWD